MLKAITSLVHGGRPTQFERLKTDKKQMKNLPYIQKNDILRDTWCACYVSWNHKNQCRKYHISQAERQESKNKVFRTRTYWILLFVLVSFHEPLRERPTLVLACAETKNHFAKVKGTGKINLMTITEQEDFNIGKYGSQVTLKALRSNKDTIFFAGPCTGGSAWNRLNESKGGETARSSRRRPFSDSAPTLRGPIRATQLVAYWNDKRMLDLMSRTDCKHFHVHGCMYGVVEQYPGAGRSKNPGHFSRAW